MEENIYEKRRRQNLYLLITTIFTLLVAMAFYSQYDLAANEHISKFNPMLVLIFTSGILAIIISFIAYITCKCKKTLEYLSYVFSIPFAMIFLYTFTGNSKPLLNALSVFHNLVLLIFIFIFLFILISILIFILPRHI